MAWRPNNNIVLFQLTLAVVISWPCTWCPCCCADFDHFNAIFYLPDSCLSKMCISRLFWQCRSWKSSMLRAATRFQRRTKTRAIFTTLRWQSSLPSLFHLQVINLVSTLSVSSDARVTSDSVWRGFSGPGSADGVTTPAGEFCGSETTTAREDGARSDRSQVSTQNYTSFIHNNVKNTLQKLRTRSHSHKSKITKWFIHTRLTKIRTAVKGKNIKTNNQTKWYVNKSHTAGTSKPEVAEK